MSFWGKLNRYGVPWKISGPVTIEQDEKLYFRDTGIYIQSTADGKLLISSDGDGTDDISIVGSITGTGDQALTGDVTLTGDLTITGAVATVATPLVVTDAATYALLAANSGRVHLLPDMSAACTISPPANTAGLMYEFEYVGGAEDAHGIVIDLGLDANFFIGGVVHLDADADDAADEIVPVYADGNSNSILTCSTVGAGTRIRIACDGTNWYVSGQVVGVTAPTFTDQA